MRKGIFIPNQGKSSGWSANRRFNKETLAEEDEVEKKRREFTKRHPIKNKK